MTDNSSIDLSLTNIWHSWCAFRQGKKASNDVIIFESDLEANLLRLCYELNNSSYIHGDYTHRIVNEKKRRDISVASVRDRVIHRLLYDYMVLIIDSSFDPDVWSCRPDKGLHKALKRVATMCKQYPTSCVWRADITKFFDHVNHEILQRCIQRKISDPKALMLLDKVIGSYTHNEQSVSQSVSQSRHGIPIGNLTSQLFANIYLNGFDRFVRHMIKPLAYVRYGDDFLLFFPSKHGAVNGQKYCTAWLESQLKLFVHHSNNIVLPVGKGLHFLGHYTYANAEIHVDQHMARKIREKISYRNVATYKSMYITEAERKILSHLLIVPKQ